VRQGGLGGAAATSLSGGGGDSGSLGGAVFVQLGGTDNDPREPALPGSADGTSVLDTARDDPKAKRVHYRRARADLAQARTH
jgi:hypothetical protein